MNTPPGTPKKRGAGFWLLLSGAGLGACCGLPMLVLVVAGLWGAVSENAATDSSSSAATAGTSAAARSNEPDDFVYKSPNGLEYVADSHVSAEGVAVTLAGEWRDDHRNIILRLRDGGRYELTQSGGVLVGEKISNSVAYGSRTAERGTWTLEGTTLTLSPESAGVSASVGLRKVDRTAEKAEPPRQWSLVGVKIQYTPEGKDVVMERSALHIRGPSPAWYYPNGDWDLILRSAPWSG